VKQTLPNDAHPGQLLRDVVLPALRLSVSQAARDLGVTRQTLHRLLAGQAAVSVDMAMRLEKLCGVPSMFWLNHQNLFELSRLSEEGAVTLSKIPEHVLPAGVAKRMGAADGA
jgi:antitoxin HigA-1